MNFFRRLTISFGLLLVLFVQPMYAASGFTIRQIQFVGLQGLTKQTALSYIPIHVGQKLNRTNSANVIQSLYATGFFDDVRLERRGSTLVVVVKERPTIGLVRMTGNKSLPNKKLWDALRKMGAMEGQPYDRRKFQMIKYGLEQQYQSMGRYDAIVNIKAVNEPRNRVALYIQINEGPIADVSRIQFIGNHAFSSGTLRDQFKLTTSGILTWLTKTDRYSKDKLEKDLTSLKNFYYDHGYLDFKILSKTVRISPDNRRVYITIRLSEGPVYRVSGYRIQGKQGQDPKVQALVTLQPGEVFSRQQVMTIDQNIANYFANKGYAFPTVRMNPTLNRNNHTVYLVFIVDPKQRMYVRKITFSGNNRTKDSVLRFQMRQMEGAAYNLSEINESKRLLQNLRYLSDIKVVPTRVPGKPDQVDLNYHVKEVNAGRASVQGGYSDTYGIVYGASISEPNFMGTGKYVKVGFQRSEYSSNYDIAYNNPFYTTYGMSRGFNVYYTKTTPSDLNLGNYTTHTLGANVNYGLPITEYTTMTFGYGFQHMGIKVTDNGSIAPSVLTFLATNPSPYNQFLFTGGLVHGSLDRAVLPTKGNFQSLSLTLGPALMSSSLGYYKSVYTGRWYLPLGKGFIFSPHVTLGYGNGFGKTGSLPFFSNFYGGGIETLPGYAPNSLGPRNPRQTGTALGGNLEMFGMVNMIFPNGISDKLRTALFVGAGNIFQTYKTPSPPGLPATTYENVSLSNMRASAGLMVEWYVPVLNWPLQFSVSKAFNTQKGDSTQIFNFSIGGSL